MAKQIDLYKLGVVLHVDGAKGLGTLKQADAELKHVDQDAKKAEASVGRFGGALNRLKSGLKSAFGGGGSGGGGVLPGLAHISNIIQGLPQIGQLAHALISPLTEAAEAGVKFNAFLETTEIALKRSFSGSREEAHKFLGEVRDFAQKSPFRTEGLIKSVIYGTATGFSPQDALQLLKDTGDAIAATGDISEETVQGVVRALSQMKAKGTVSAEEMEQLAERGIPAWEMLAHAIGKTVAETRKLGETGKLNGVAAVEALRAEMRARYGGMIDELQNSFTGRQSALEDIGQSAGGVATESLFNSLNRSMGTALERSDLPNKIAASIDSALKPVGSLIEGSAKMLLGEGLTSGLREGINAGKDLVMKTVTDFALDSVIGKFKSIFQINSPSLVMAAIGQGIGEGFEQGAAASLDAAQQEIVKKIVAIGRAVGATTNEIKAALATAWVESKFRNLNHGDRDSLGVFQQRPSQGWGTPEQLLNPDYATRQFFSEAMRRRSRGLAPSALAQSVQRSGFPDRYEEALPLVNALVRNLGEGSGIEPGRVRQAWEVLAEFARMRGFTVTSTTGGKHNAGSLHARGLAVDIRTRDKSPEEVAALMAEARAAGIRVRDERSRPTGQAVWGGPHLHLSLPNGVVSNTNPMPVVVLGGAAAAFSSGRAGTRTVTGGGVDGGISTASDTPFFGEINSAIGTELIAPMKTLDAAVTPLTQNVKRAELAAGSFATKVIQSGEKLSTKLNGMLAGVGGLLPQQQVGKKRGLFGRILGAAAPFLNFIPAVGPILSQVASIASSGLQGDWSGAFTQAAGGFATGGAFRPSSSGGAAGKANLPGREYGGPVRAGRSYIVGERRAEIFTPERDGWIHPNASSYSGGGHDGHWSQLIVRAIESLETRINSVPPEHVLAAGARRSPGVITDAFMTHSARDHRVIEYMTRTVNG